MSVKSYCTIASLISLSLYSSYGLCTINPSDLIKATPSATCVEYYQYKGELYCSTKALQPSAIDPHIKEYEKQKIMFDDRPWLASWGTQSPTITTVEYVPMGDDINNWKELITSQFIPDIQNSISPADFANKFIENLKASGYSPIINFIKTTPDQVIFEFRIDSPKTQLQDELQIITKGSNGFYILHYVIKEADMGKVNRDKWLGLLQKSGVK